MTTEQLKLKFIFKSGRFTCNGEKFILDVEATKALNEKRGVPMNASVIWLVGNSPDGSSQIEERSYLCGKLKDPIAGAPTEVFDAEKQDIGTQDEVGKTTPAEEEVSQEVEEHRTFQMKRMIPGYKFPPTTVEEVDKETGTSEKDSTGSPETNEPEVKPKTEIVKAKEAKKKPAAKKIKPAAKKKSPVKKVVKK